MKQDAQVSQAIIKTPLGYLNITISESKVSGIDFLGARHRNLQSNGKLSKQAAQQVEKYFLSSNHEFDLPLSLAGTQFQKKVWHVLQKIPAGQTRTYGQIAKQLKTASQAVGNACRANPIPIIVPCHRVVSASGLGGYMGKTSGSKTDIKQWLLDHEQAQ